MNSERLKPGPKGPRNPEAVIADLPLEVIIDLVEPLQYEHRGEQLLVSRRLARSLAVTLKTGGFSSVSGPTAARYRAIVRSIPPEHIPTPIDKGRRGRKLSTVGAGFAMAAVSILHPSGATRAQADWVDAAQRPQVDITRRGRARVGRRGLADIFDELRGAA